MAKRLNYRMISSSENMQRTPGLTPIDHPAPIRRNVFEPNDETGELGVQEKDDDTTATPARMSQKKQRDSDKTPNSGAKTTAGSTKDRNTPSRSARR
jgi:hypothetical protein